MKKFPFRWGGRGGGGKQASTEGRKRQSTNQVFLAGIQIYVETGGGAGIHFLEEERKNKILFHFLRQRGGESTERIETAFIARKTVKKEGRTTSLTREGKEKKGERKGSLILN